MLGFGGTVVPKVNLILTLVCRDYFAERSLQDPNFTYLPVLLGEDNSQCRIPEVQSLVARFQLYLNLIAGVLSALASPRLGHLSDRYGRTKIIALGTLGAVLSEVITVIVAAKPESASVNLLFLGAIFDGLGGSYTTAVALVTSYASDCSRLETRNVAFGYYHGVLFAGTAAGPFLAAFILKHGGRVLDIFCVALAFQTLYLLTVWLVVPESLSEEQQQIAQEKHQIKREREDASLLSRWNPLTLITPLSILLPPVGRSSALFPNRGGASRPLQRNIVLLTSMDTVVFGVALGTAQVVIIYAQYMFGWGNVESSMFVFTINIVRVANLFLVLPLVTRFFRRPSTEEHSIMGSDTLDVTLIRLSIVFDVLGYVGYALSKHGSVMIASGVITALGGMGPSILQSSLTKHVPRDRVGQILGAIGLLHALARITAPALFSLIYSLTVGKFTQAVFVCLTGVFGLAFIFSLFIQPHGSYCILPFDLFFSSYNQQPTLTLTILLAMTMVKWMEMVKGKTMPCCIRSPNVNQCTVELEKSPINPLIPGISKISYAHNPCALYIKPKTE